MAKVKISDLEDAATLDGTELVELEQDGGSVKCTTQDIADLGGGSSYLKYVALLSQTGTSAPVATVLENTLGGAIVWAYNGVGDYIGTLTGAFTADQTGIFLGNTNAKFWYAYRNNADEVQIEIYDETNTPLDDGLTETMIEIRVYP
jgi:hypothetical protein